MDNEYISKKELLELTEVSYGQLYRWKRKKLIPEDWFIRKSTFTGQETFFPKAKMLERLEKIKNMKDDLSLDNIAEMFSPELADILLNKEDMLKKNIVSQTALNMYEKHHGETGVYSFEKILYIAVLDKFLHTGSVSLDEGRAVLKTLEDNYIKFKGKQCEIVFIRKLGISICFLIAVPNEFSMEEDVKMTEKINLSKCMEEIKIKIV